MTAWSDLALSSAAPKFFSVVITSEQILSVQCGLSCVTMEPITAVIDVSAPGNFYERVCTVFRVCSFHCSPAADAKNLFGKRRHQP